MYIGLTMKTNFMYNWQHKDWRKFKFDEASIKEELKTFERIAAYTAGILKGIPDQTRIDSIVDVLVSEALKSSEIEGEYMSRKDVMSSIKQNLGLQSRVGSIKDKKAQGISDLIVHARQTYREALSQETLFKWHTMVMADAKGILIGQWRKHSEPMQVISGPIGKMKVHFEAPPSSLVPKEMKYFIEWFNSTGPGGKYEIQSAPLRASISHLYFESIHPFEDGNGRIGRALAEKALSQTLGYPILLSISKIIEANKKEYYDALEQAQHSNHITAWINYFVQTILLAQQDAEDHINFILKKTKFFDRFREQLQERQIKVIYRMMDAGSAGFIGGMNAAKYIGITACSKATATRDMQHLVDLNIFKSVGGGRSTRYELMI